MGQESFGMRPSQKNEMTSFGNEHTDRMQGNRTGGQNVRSPMWREEQGWEAGKCNKSTLRCEKTARLSL